MSDQPSITLVIPGRNCASTIAACLEAVTPMLHRPELNLSEIIFVDDGSTDDTVDIARRFAGVTILPGAGRGPASARNLGWRSASGDLIWFVDADCIAEPDALEKLLPHLQSAGHRGLSGAKATQSASSHPSDTSPVAFDDSDHGTHVRRRDVESDVGGVSGSYGNMRPESLLACLIHEEIIARHRRMAARGPEVDFLATFNVLYRRSVLEEIGGFDERYLKGQDAELSFRALEAGYRLHFEIESRVKHYHETHWLRYLRTQRQQGYWRVFLHLQHRGHSAGDSYSSIIDHAQPLLAMISIASLPLLLFPWTWWVPLLLIAMLVVSTLPMTTRILRATGSPDALAFPALSFLRAYWRGVGMSVGTLAWIARAMAPSPATDPASHGAPHRP